MKKKALITGTSGQDGSYLAELLLDKGYDVYGTIRRNSIESQETTRLAHIMDRLTLEHVDVTDGASVADFVKLVKPDEVYHLASMSQVGISFLQPIYTLESVLQSTINVLHSVKQFCPNARYYQACSSEMFGNESCKELQSETSPKNPVSPYGICKLAAYHFTREYRKSYNIFASNGILFNHESPRRGETFVTQKVVRGAYEISKGRKDCLELGNLNSRRDWGHAKDYVNAMWMILQHDKPDDFVCATGEAYSVRDLCKYVFSAFDLDYNDYVKSNTPKFERPEDLIYLKGDSTKLQTDLGWKTEYTFETLLDDMIAEVKKGDV